MATLKAMFKLFDGYSSTINKIVSGTDKATKSVLSASKGTDAYNDSLEKTGAAASTANSGLMKIVGTVVTLASVKKTMDLTDTYTNTAARLKMVNDGTQTQLELQDKIFASANRARGSYTDMASAVAKMNLLAGDSFGSNDEAIGFTELLQKSLKVSGAGKSEQDSAFLQLSQAMAAGKLQGDEFRSVMENAPMVADAIAKYMGKTKGELKELSADGAITSDIIKGAMFAAADDINNKFATMPMTFSDTWNKIKNAGNQAFGGVFEKLNKALNSPEGQAALNNIIGLIYNAADACNSLLDGASAVYDFMSKSWPYISPFIWGVVAALVAYNIAQGITNLITGAAALISGAHAAALAMQSGATFTATAAQYGFNAALLACPLTWIIILVLVLVAAFYAAVAAINHFAGTSISATGLILGVMGAFAAFIVNQMIYVYNMIAIIINAIANAFNDPVAAIQVLFYDMAVNVLGYFQSIAKGVEDLINKIPGVQVDITSKVDDLIGGMKDKSKSIKDASGWKEYVKPLDYLNMTDEAKRGYKGGKGIEDGVSKALSGFNPNDNKDQFDFSKFATDGNPAVIEGKGKNKAVKVENEEDIEWLRKLAERDYVARISQNTLAPNIRVEFSGPITREADVDGVAAHIGGILKEQIATAPEGVN